jgi:hypothetical protein
MDVSKNKRKEMIGIDEDEKTASADGCLYDK